MQDGLAVASAHISDLSWLQGYWLHRDGPSSSEETWLPPRAGAMYGLHVDVFSSGRSFFEFLRIESRGDTLAYIVNPRGRPSTTFLATVVSDREVVFSNPNHDYPQNISYAMVGADSLRAEIWGSSTGEERRSSSTWGRSTFPVTADGH
ncbi:MAG: DUF6265 family protein [Rhodothermales bacterium]|nr:DUF6265 family protein [Rhodothermales bacterium]